MFSLHERLGIFCSIEAGCLSVLGTSIILIYALVNWIQRQLSSWRGRERHRLPDAADSSLFLNLMLSDLIQALGILPSIKWINDGLITPGTSMCEAQAVLKQLGINGVALSSSAIGVHTFIVLVLRWRLPRYAGLITSFGIWVFTALVVGLNKAVHKSDYFTDTGYWCWVNPKFRSSQLTSEYLWMWMAAILMLILYGIMFLAMKGIITIPYANDFRADNDETNKICQVANLMLYYPAIYIICVLPNSISRWMSFSGEHVNPGYALFASTLFSLSGFFNALLYMLTRPTLVRQPVVYVAPRLPSVIDNDNDASPNQWTSRSPGAGYLPDLEK